ncbi:MAG TPA: Crp/Fnr family transcriptional regulator, partial [Solirubrobacterales bacterium]|nr:Crp/Fnr family transcriptional regulator [Solirubrobacterales bacterium]
MPTIPVLQIDPDLADGIAGHRLFGAVRACHADAIEIPLGRWDVDALDGERSGFGLLVVSGILCRRVVQGESNGAEIVGPGDLLRPWESFGEWASIPTESSWRVIEPGQLAILDRDFVRRANPYPEVSIALMRRALQRSRYLAVLIAIIGQRRVETRLTMLFWHLADRFGHVSGGWVDIPVPLTHGTLAELVAARRPSVTTALSRLYERGVLQRDRRGWRLRGTVPP